MYSCIIYIVKYATWLVCLLFTCTTIAQESRPTLIINNTNYPPYSTPGRDGYLDLIAQEAFRRIGVQLKLVVLPPERGLLNANAGSLDGDMVRIAGLKSKYPQLLQVPENIMVWEFEAFSKSAIHSASPAYIRDHPVAYLKGWKIYEKYLNGAKYTTAVNRPEQLFRLVELGRVDNILYERWLGLALIRKMHLDDIRPTQPLIARQKMYIYLNRRNKIYISPLASALQNMKRDGYYQKVFNKTLKPYLSSLH